MKPTTFKEQNCTLGKDQSEYLPLPAFKEPDGMVLSCWKLSIWERLRALFVGRVWVWTLTFNQPLQPLILTTKASFDEDQAA